MIPVEIWRWMLDRKLWDMTDVSWKNTTWSLGQSVRILHVFLLHFSFFFETCLQIVPKEMECWFLSHLGSQLAKEQRLIESIGFPAVILSRSLLDLVMPDNQSLTAKTWITESQKPSFESWRALHGSGIRSASTRFLWLRSAYERERELCWTAIIDPWSFSWFYGCPKLLYARWKWLLAGTGQTVIQLASA